MNHLRDLNQFDVMFYVHIAICRQINGQILATGNFLQPAALKKTAFSKIELGCRVAHHIQLLHL